MDNFEAFKADLKELIKKHKVTVDVYPDYNGSGELCSSPSHFIVDGESNLDVTVSDVFKSLWKEISQEGEDDFDFNVND